MTQPTITDLRRERYAAAIRENVYVAVGDLNKCADAAMAVADQEQRAMLPTARASLERYAEENARLRAEAAEVRAAAFEEGAAEASQIATEMRKGEWSEEMTTREVRDACEHVASSLRRMAAAARPDDTTGA